jgi:minor histocompatibility antigen H13
MVTVAKGIDAPIKILASKTPFSSTLPSDFAMLGLGDIVIPGLVIALCLRFDLARYAKAHSTKDVTSRSSFTKPYFWVGIVSYVLGLATTMGVMHWTRHAQPALLYLSPACSESPSETYAIRDPS